MRRAVPLSSLTAGRCFTLAAPPSTADEDAKRFTQGRSILQADTVFKVGAASNEGVAVENALGERQTLPGATLVSEIPRQGFDRLVERAREA